MHRAGTLFHIVATTSLNWFSKKSFGDQTTQNAEDAVELAKNLAKLKEDENDPRASRQSQVSASSGGERSSLLRTGTVYR